MAPVTVTFPIPEDQYEQAILALEKSQIGDARVQDCLIDNVRAPNCPALVRMTGTMANVDELDWLGKQLESFDRYELLQFNAAVERFGLSGRHHHPAGGRRDGRKSREALRPGSTAMDAAATKDMLAQFGDYRSVASWAKEPMAFCYSVNILDQSDLNIEPTKAILRCEIAQMLYNMLTAAELI